MWEKFKRAWARYQELNDPVLSWIPVLIIISIILLLALSFQEPTILVRILSLFLSLAIIILVFSYAQNMIMLVDDYVEDIGLEVKTARTEALQELPVGIMIYDEEYRIKWLNPFLQRFWKGQTVIGRKIEEVDKEFYQAFLEWIDPEELDSDSAEDEKVDKLYNWNDHYFHVEHMPEYKTIYLLDVTEYGHIADIVKDNQIVIGYISVDNYDDIVKNIASTSKSTVDSIVLSNLEEWARKFDSYIDQLQEDRFLVVSTHENLVLMQENNFRILDIIRDKTSVANLQLSISMGFAYSDDTANVSTPKLASQAVKNLDMALGRGGDQVVIKTENNPAIFFGGKTNPMVKRTRTRARRTSELLQSLIQVTDQVIVMGHQFPDADSIGSCLGVYRICQMNQIDCKIVINKDQFSEDVERIYQLIQKDGEYSEDIFIDAQRANAIIDRDTLLITVDVHKRAIFAAPDLIDRTDNVVIIDHHRKSEISGENVILEYIEPYASSSSELISEFFEFQPTDQGGLTQLEATIMLAGIVVDTRNFSLRTGSRTFDAASFLITQGASTVLIQKILKEDVTSYLTRSHLLSSIEYVVDGYAIVTGENDVAYDNVLASQTADTMLSLNNCEAAFVVFRREDRRVGISARSLGTVNVQVVMEKMGGGGHLSNAATQIESGTVEEVAKELEKMIIENLKEDD